ncbi:maleylacetoacetate isomerase [Caulobacter sp. CCUG 60055]|nr:maleylacetoacetate isomerase [Caulobacter sp. CCUG 60055]MBQ1543479.1 maleylacetoacetate isomerase [Caulobacteraceae bacterium]MCI3179626.1 maleylacetoacetate isomerase [Caulobacter sp. CCUG 60055]
MSVPILHAYWRSGTSYRTRIALNLKGLAYETAPVDLRAGEQKSDAYRALNPQGLVPALEIDGAVLTQSPAILEWLEEAHPTPPLLPADAVGRAHVRAMAALVACDIHPLNNLRILQTLKNDLGAGEDQVKAWTARWIGDGFSALEALIGRHGRGWAYGDAPTLADCCLIPQVYSAERFEVDLSPYPRIRAVAEQAGGHPAFAAARPDRQPDAG